MSSAPTRRCTVFSIFGHECIDDFASVPPVQHGHQRSFYRHFEEVHGGRNFDAVLTDKKESIVDAVLTH